MPAELTRISTSRTFVQSVASIHGVVEFVCATGRVRLYRGRVRSRHGLSSFVRESSSFAPRAEFVCTGVEFVSATGRVRLYRGRVRSRHRSSSFVPRPSSFAPQVEFVCTEAEFVRATGRVRLYRGRVRSRHGPSSFVPRPSSFVSAFNLAGSARIARSLDSRESPGIAQDTPTARPLLFNIVKRSGSVLGFRAGRGDLLAIVVTTGTAGKFRLNRPRSGGAGR